MPQTLAIPCWIYQHFGADLSLEHPEHNFGGWKKVTLDFARERTAVVSMHVWDVEGPERYPRAWTVYPYFARTGRIVEEVYPRLFEAVRGAGLPLFHVAGGNDYYRHYPGYKRAMELAGETAPDQRLDKVPERVESDPAQEAFNQFRREHGYPGAGNTEEGQAVHRSLRFPKAAEPQGDEGVAENSAQLLALCRERGINHLIYCGFAVNWCILASPGGMNEMHRHGITCSIIRDATTAIENRESIAGEDHKEEALWRVSMCYGFVFEAGDVVGALRR